MTLTDAQKEAIKAMRDFIKNGDPRKWFNLEGKAGVGKTTVLVDLMLSYNSKKNIVACAVAHKAKNVLYDKMKYKMYKDVSRNTISFHSVASLLGAKFDETTGEFVIEKTYGLLRPIDSAEVIIVDECSMISEDIMKHIMHYKRPMCKVIFSGDRGQLPPIRDNGGDAESDTFNTDFKFKLFERLRQGDESPILPFSDHYWDSVMRNDNVCISPPRESINTDKGSILFGGVYDVVSYSIDLFKRVIKDREINLIKIVCYRNNTINDINNYIRNMVFGCPRQFEVGDILMLYDNYKLSDNDTMENSTEFQVVDVDMYDDSVDGIQLSVYSLTVDYEMFGGECAVINVLSSESVPAFNSLVYNLFDIARGKPINTRDRSEAFKYAYKVKNRYANVRYAYCISSHKAQGSTYKAVIVHEDDIMSVQMTTLRTKYRSMYTAITRASHVCIIMRN